MPSITAPTDAVPLPPRAFLASLTETLVAALPSTASLTTLVTLGKDEFHQVVSFLSTYLAVCLCNQGGSTAATAASTASAVAGLLRALLHRRRLTGAATLTTNASSRGDARASEAGGLRVAILACVHHLRGMAAVRPSAEGSEARRNEDAVAPLVALMMNATNWSDPRSPTTALLLPSGLPSAPISFLAVQLAAAAALTPETLTEADAATQLQTFRSIIKAILTTPSTAAATGRAKIAIVLRVAAANARSPQRAVLHEDLQPGSMSPSEIAVSLEVLSSRGVSSECLSPLLLFADRLSSEAMKLEATAAAVEGGLEAAVPEDDDEDDEDDAMDVEDALVIEEPRKKAAKSAKGGITSRAEATSLCALALTVACEAIGAVAALTTARLRGTEEDEHAVSPTAAEGASNEEVQAAKSALSERCQTLVRCASLAETDGKGRMLLDSPPTGTGSTVASAVVAPAAAVEAAALKCVATFAGAVGVDGCKVRMGE